MPFCWMSTSSWARSRERAESWQSGILHASLNSVVDAGPSLLPYLTGLLLRFREFEHVVQADTRKAFFMVSLREGDRPFVRFVWLASAGVMTTWRLTKVPFGVNCSPFLLNAVLQTYIHDR